MTLVQKLILLCVMVLVVGILGLGVLLARLENRIANLEYNLAHAPVAAAATVSSPSAVVTDRAPAPPLAPTVLPAPVASTPAATAATAEVTPAPTASNWQAGGTATGNTYYVAATGTPAGSGTKEAPFREIRQVIPALKPGDTVLVADGQYQGFTIKGLHGTATQVISFKATGQRAEIMPTSDRSDNRDTMYLDDCTYILIEGLRSFHANRAAIRLEGGHHIAIRNGTYGENKVWGIFTGHTDDLLLEHNECYSSAEQHGIYVSNSAKRPIIRNNYCHDNYACGIQINADLGCGPDGLTTGAILADNLCIGNGKKGGAAINLDGVQDSLVANNLLVDNHASGIVIYKHDGAAGPHGVRVIHNTIIMANNARYCLQIGNTTGPNLVRNNLLINQNATRGGIAYDQASDAANVDSDYNCYGSDAAVIATDDWHTRIPLADWQAKGHETHSFTAPLAALFRAPGQDHHLSATSPALAKGDPSAGIPRDADGRPRDPKAAPDLGCFAGK